MFGGKTIPFVLKKRASGIILRLIHHKQSYNP